MNPTASEHGLAFACAYPWVPGVSHSRSSGAAAALGTAFHDLAATVINARIPQSAVLDVGAVGIKYKLSDDQTETLARMVAGWRESWVGAREQQAEVAFAYNPLTGTARVLPSSGEHRDYSQALPEEFVGTADVVATVELGRVDILDWKCGQRQYVTQPRENRQLRFLAMCAALVYRVDLALVSLAFVDPEGQVFVESAELDAFELAAIAGEVAGLAQKLASNPEPQVGPHCRWCPAVAACPKSQVALAEIAPVPPPAPFAVVTEVGAITGPDHASWLLHRLRAVKAAVEVVETALQTYADQHGGIQTGSGATWQRREVVVERIKLDSAAKTELERVLPGAVQFATTKRAIEDAARAAKLPLKQTKDETLALLRALGVVSSSVTVKYEDK